MPQVKYSPEHQALWDDLTECINRHGNVPGDEVLAVAANLLGHLMAARDPGNDRPREMVDLVNANILMGQREARSALSGGIRH